MRTLRNVSVLSLPCEEKPYHLNSVDGRITPRGLVIRGTMTLLYEPFMCEKIRFYVEVTSWKQVALRVVPFALHFGSYECFRYILLSVDEAIRGRVLSNKPVTYDGIFGKDVVDDVIRNVRNLRFYASSLRQLLAE